jgi:hypothetical protein
VQDIRLLMRHVGRFSFPPGFPLSRLETARTDLELIATKLRERPEQVQALLQAVVSGRNAKAGRLIEELGLRESDFQGQAAVFLGGRYCGGFSVVRAKVQL